MAWTINYTSSALKELRKLDKKSSTRILDYMNQSVATLDDPRSIGKALKGKLSTYWRYRIGNFRIICQIVDNELVVLVIRVGHRKNVYQ